MNGKQRHGGENIHTAICLDEQFEHKILFWFLQRESGFCALKFILVLHDFRFSLEGNVWLSASQEDKLSLRLFLTLDPAGHIQAISVLMLICQ